MAEEVEDWGTNNQVRKSENNLFIPRQELGKDSKHSNILDALTKCLVTMVIILMVSFIRANKCGVKNNPCYLICNSSSLFNTPRFPSLLNSLHSFDAFLRVMKLRKLFYLPPMDKIFELVLGQRCQPKNRNLGDINPKKNC